MGYQQDDEDEDQTTTEEAPETSSEESAGPSDDDEDLSKAAADDQATDAKPEQNPDEKSRQVREWLDKQYGNAADTAKLQAARGQEQQAVQRAGVIHGISQMFGAQSAAVGGPDSSQKDYQTALQQAHVPVAQAEEDRQNAIKDFLTDQNLGRQSDADQQKQKLWKVENDLNDPASPKSQMAVHLFQSQFPDALKGWSDEEKAQLTASDIGKLALPGQEKVAQLKMAHEAAMQRLGLARDRQTAVLDAKGRQLANGDLKDLGKDLDSETASGRSGLGVAQTKVDSANRLLTFADVNPNSPEDMGMLRASKTDPKAREAMTAKLNSLTPQQYNEVVSGVMTQVANGGGSLGQFEHLKASTAAETLTNLKQYFKNHPEPAQLGAFVLNNLQTLANERDTSQAVLDKHAAAMRAKHPHAFQHPETSDLAESMVKGFAQPPAPEPKPAQDPAAAVAGGAPTLQDVQAEIARRKSGKVAAK